MLVELTIRNFAVIEETRIEFGPSLNALTGETGAGKSIVLDALGAVLGERTSPSVVRAGADRAYVEAIFDLADLAQRESLVSKLAEFGVEDGDENLLILSRDITPNRSTARINGRAVTATALTDIRELLVDIHGQSDHLSLLRPQAQLEMLDSFAGTASLRTRVRELFESWRTIQRRIQAFDRERRAHAQRVDFLQLQLGEIENVAPQQDEQDELEAERHRLTHAVRLLSLAEQSRSLFEGGEDLAAGERGSLDQLRSVESALLEMSRLDPSTEPYLRQLRDALYTLDELSSELRGYLDLLDVDPDRLDVVNQRMLELRELTRKYGSTIDEVLEHAENIRTELEEIDAGSTDIEGLRAQEREAAMRLAEAAIDLSQQRSAAGQRLAGRVESTISELNMGSAHFEVAVRHREDGNGIQVDGRQVGVDATGIDAVAFLLAANPGSAPQPLGRVASGGETARLMLAMKSILSEADATPTLVFDEIDVGIGGRSGQIVGEKLWNLTGTHQVIVISHLPQVAAFADRHTAMVKSQIDGTTVTSAEELEGDASVDEIATMFDGKPVSPESRANALALLKRVNTWKANAGSVAGT
ncbi:MAG: DNA repair protein RecN [Thermomicrobiales bacterium]